MELKYNFGVQVVMDYREVLLQSVCMVYGILKRSLVVMVSIVEQDNLKDNAQKYVIVCINPYSRVTIIFITSLQQGLVCSVYNTGHFNTFKYGLVCIHVIRYLITL